MLDCREFIKCLSDYMDGELDESMLVEFEEHIESCDSARCVVETFRRTILLHRKARGARVPTRVSVPFARIPADVSASEPVQADSTALDVKRR